MRLGLVRFKYDSSGGAEKTLGLLAGGLIARGHEVHVVVSRWQGEALPGLSLHELGVGRRAFAQAVLGKIKPLGLDTWLSLDRVPHSPVVRAGDGCHAAWLKRRAPHESALKRLLLGIGPRHRAVLDLERRMFQAPELKLVIANSRLVARELDEFYGLGPERVRVVYNGVARAGLIPAPDAGARADLERELGLNPGARLLLFLGSGFERKGLAFAIRALTHLPEAVLLVAGRDRPGPYLRLAAKLGLKERVFMLGQRGDVPSLIAGCGAMVLPTIYDPCANACLEALAAGLPVVTTSANGAAELIDQGQSGLVVENPAGEHGLAHACAQALELHPTGPGRVPTAAAGVDETLGVLEAVASGGTA